MIHLLYIQMYKNCGKVQTVSILNSLEQNYLESLCEKNIII